MQRLETIGIIMVSLAALLYIVSIVDHMVFQLEAMEEEMPMWERIKPAWPLILFALLIVPGAICIHISRRKKKN